MLPGRTPEHRRTQAAWVRYVRQRQLDESLGWQKQDACFGGWGYSVDFPRKFGNAAIDDANDCSNISATVYGLGALRMAEVPMSDAAYSNVLLFVSRCQNFSEDLSNANPDFDDGGFFFTPDDAARNKAGVAGIDHLGRTRFHSYGAATADGLRCLLHAGRPISDPRVIAARHWLEAHFSPDQNPGIFESDREVLRNATYFYYCWSMAHAFLHLDEPDRIPSVSSPLSWPERLAAELISRQHSDGSWVNVFRDSKEDDPLVATPYAVAAMSICRSLIARRAGFLPVPTRDSHRAPS